jgi:RNA polymerase sigma factor (sigma-70 family)
MTPEDLFKACCDTSNAEAWGEFYRLYDALIRNIVRRMLARAPASDIFEDLVQETYVRLTAKNCRALADFRSQGPNSDFGFVKRVAASTVLDHFKRNSISMISFEEIPESIPQEPDLDRALFVEECFDAATEPGQNRDRDRRIFLLYYRIGLKSREIAALRSIGLETKGVESVIHKTVGAIKKRLQLKRKPVHNKKADSGTVEEPA